MPVHAGDGAGLEIPAGDPEDVVVLELGGLGGDVANKWHGAISERAADKSIACSASSFRFDVPKR